MLISLRLATIKARVTGKRAAAYAVSDHCLRERDLTVSLIFSQLWPAKIVAGRYLGLNVDAAMAVGEADSPRVTGDVGGGLWKSVKLTSPALPSPSPNADLSSTFRMASFPPRPLPRKVYTPQQAAYYAQPAWLRVLRSKTSIVTLAATGAYLGDHFLLEGSIVRTARTLTTGSVI